MSRADTGVARVLRHQGRLVYNRVPRETEGMRGGLHRHLAAETLSPGSLGLCEGAEVIDTKL
jgi:hypothetical protein